MGTNYDVPYYIIFFVIWFCSSLFHIFFSESCSPIQSSSLCNSIIGAGRFPTQWSVAQIIMIPKPGKPLQEVGLYTLISLLPVTSKFFEKVQDYKKTESSRTINLDFGSNIIPSNKSTELQGS